LQKLHEICTFIFDTLGFLKFKQGGKEFLGVAETEPYLLKWGRMDFSPKRECPIGIQNGKSREAALPDKPD
jgi:hypothetical protein